MNHFGSIERGIKRCNRQCLLNLLQSTLLTKRLVRQCLTNLLELIILAFRFCRHCLQNSRIGEIEFTAERKASF